jgi:hypothetical protein
MPMTIITNCWWTFRGKLRQIVSEEETPEHFVDLPSSSPSQIQPMP